MKNLSISILLILLSFQLSVAQNEFSYFIPNAAAIGYGSSAVTQTDNPAIVYWNPGGIAFATNDNILINATDPFALNYLSFTRFSPPSNAIGFSLSRFTVDQKNLEVITAAYSCRISQFFSIGANINYGQIDHDEDHFVSASLGCLLKPAINRYSFYQAANSPWHLFFNPALYEKFALGIMIHNIPLDQSAIMHAVRIGTAFKFTNWGPIFNLGYHIHHGENSSHTGFGISLLSNFHLYAGVIDFNIQNLSFGTSISLGMFSTHASYSVQTERLTLSLSVRFKDDANVLAKSYADRGMRMVRENDFRGGFKEFEKSLSYNQNNERVVYLTNILKKRIERENLKIDSLLTQAAHFRERSWNVNAILTYKKILELDQNNKQAIAQINNLKPFINRYTGLLFQKGKSYYQKNELQKSKTIFADILQLNENHAGAKKYLAKIDSMSSHLSNEYYYRGLGYYKQRHLDRSRENFRRVVELNPGHKEAQYYLNKINQELQSNTDRIEKLFQEAHSLEKQGNYLLASIKYKEILQINQDDTRANRQLELLQAYVDTILSRKLTAAKRTFERGDYQQAQAEFKEILSIQPDHLQAKQYLKRIRDAQSGKIQNHYQQALNLSEQKRWNEALHECEQVLQIDSEHWEAQKLQKNILMNISIDNLQQQGLQLFTNGQYFSALKVFNQIIEKDPHHVIAKSYIKECRDKLSKRVTELFNSGMRFYTSSDYEAAIREWNRVLEIDPKNQSAIEYKNRAQERLDALKELP